MNTFVFILLRLYATTLGRISCFALQLKKVMIYFLIRRAPKKYVAATKYFDHIAFFHVKDKSL